MQSSAYDLIIRDLEAEIEAKDIVRTLRSLAYDWDSGELELVVALYHLAQLGARADRVVLSGDWDSLHTRRGS